MLRNDSPCSKLLFLYWRVSGLESQKGVGDSSVFICSPKIGSVVWCHIDFPPTGWGPVLGHGSSCVGGVVHLQKENRSPKENR